MPLAHFAIKAQRRKAARLRKLRRRFSIHYRSGSNPNERSSKKKTAPLSGDCFFLADRVGFEPTSLLRDYLISSQGRYDHFDTCPSVCCAIIPKAQEKIKPNPNQIVHI